MCSLLFTFCLPAQSIKLFGNKEKASFRGLSVVDNKVIWVSGSGGRVGKSLDGGLTWKWITIKGYKNCEFRDIEGFDGNTAIVMAVAEPAYILKTSDGGKNWQKVYENKNKGMFLDAMEFENEKNGWVIGDPMDGRFFIAKTNDAGNSWQEVPPADCPTADSAEACFASSGTNIRLMKSGHFLFVTGGASSHLVIGKGKIKLPLNQGLSSTGANSVAVKDSLTYMVVGGDFTREEEAKGNCAFTSDGGRTWNIPNRPPNGYRSCVEYIGGDTWICCGLTGADISKDNGITWTSLSKNSFHACKKAKNGTTVFFSGNGGKVGKLAE